MSDSAPHYSILNLYNKIMLSLEMGVLPSAIENEDNRNVEALIYTKSLIEKKKAMERNKNG